MSMKVQKQQVQTAVVELTLIDIVEIVKRQAGVGALEFCHLAQSGDNFTFYFSSNTSDTPAATTPSTVNKEAAPLSTP